MSDTDAPGDIYTVFEVAEAGAPDTPVGEAELSADGMLKLTGGPPDKAAYLTEAFARVNGKATLSQLVGPEPGGSRFALGSKTVARDDPAFFDALQTYLTTYFGIRLG